MTVVLGVDPGSQNTGVGVVRAAGSSIELLEYSTLRAKRGDPIERRLAQLAGQLEELLSRVKPEAAALERVFSAKNAQSALMLGQARGAILAVLGRHKLPLAEYAPAEVKLAVGGHGACTKEKMARMASRILGAKLDEAEHDATDAVAIAICHAQELARRRWLERTERA